MNPRLDVMILGLLAGLVGLFQLAPLALALALGEPGGPFVPGLAVGLLLAAAGLVAGRGASRTVRPRDGFLVVGVGWILASAISAVPFVASGATGPVDAWFEAVSGITTTGSTILVDIEAQSASLLFWRSMTQWIGGMGIIVFTIAILPLLGVGGMQLFRAEVPGPVTDKIAPRVTVTARYLWLVYVGLTAIEALLLRAFGMPALEAVDHAFTTMATGGFSPKAASIGAYDSPLIRVTVIVFMALAGMNFVLHFKAFQGRLRDVLRDEELRWYLALIALFAIPMTVVLALVEQQPLGRAAEDAFFTVVSLMTTTGYATADYELWPLVTHGPIILLLILGGMAGSTGGGVKTLRTLLAFRSLRASFSRMLHPHAVRPVVYRGRPVPGPVMEAIWGFFAAYITLAVLGMLVVNMTGADLVTSWSASLTALGNVGPGLGAVGPVDNFAALPGGVKLVLSALMLFGRLELYTLLLLLMPGFWRR
ncbi:MAG: TrkH family potassium uptake protein [Acidobacteria bacterium]|nr:MAG: TrkH family potassium uptake protein [Acidobacteriota bacterium]